MELIRIPCKLKLVSIASFSPIAKTLFVSRRNYEKTEENFVKCRLCGRRFHTICALHMDEIWTSGYFCPICLRSLGKSREVNPFTAKNLPTEDLSSFLESKVNNFLNEKRVQGGKVIVRVLASSYKFTEVGPFMKEYLLKSGMPVGDHPYRYKGIYAFQEINGQEVCFFGFYTQEHGLESLQPNRGHVYLAYVDSVFFFRPKRYRTDVYHIILNSYMQYVKQSGFSKVHIWVCPPFDGGAYIFNKHPPDQKIPQERRLQSWYTDMLQKAKDQGIVEDFKDIYQDAIERSLQFAYELPYFEGNYWPTILESIFEVGRAIYNALLFRIKLRERAFLLAIANAR